MNATLRALAAEAEARPFARRRVIAATLGEGREALRALARASSGWIGFEPVTPWIIATEIASDILAATGSRIADEFEQLALLDEAIDHVVGTVPGVLTALAEGPGLRQAVAESVRELRHTGVSADLLARTPMRDVVKRRTLAAILRGYEAALERESAVDAAGVFRIALQALAAGTAVPAEAIYLLLPGPDRRGLAGRLLDHVVAGGAIVLPADPVLGLDPPASHFVRAAPPEDTRPSLLACLHAPEFASPADAAAASVDVFAAGSVTDELREVLRRVAGQGLPWDEVEIIATDPAAYGAALDGLARRLDIPVSFAAGLPVARTRPGRAVRSYLQWVREELPADAIRAMLERGDLASPDGDVSGVALARRVRRLRVGRGKERWESALIAAERAADADVSPEDERPPDEAEAARQRERVEVAALIAVLRPVLDATPEVPDRLRTRDVAVRPSDLARGLLALLEFVPAPSAVDTTAKARLEKRLARIAETLVRPTTIDAAAALLEAKLDSRVPAPDEGGSAPWSASGGRLHLSDLRHGGWTGRRATFVVGLDTGRFPAGGVQDAILTDRDRYGLTTGQDVPTMPTTGERVDEARYQLASMLSRLRGEVTLSWAAWEAAEARVLAPAPEILQAYRLREGDPTRDYEELQRSVGIATPVPRPGAAHLDAADVWLAALSEGGTLRDGEAVVRAAFEGLDLGLTGAAARKADTYSSFHGRVRPRPGLDPRTHPTIVLSASRLETLGTCPLRYFMRTVLRVRPPDDVEMDPDRWLSPLQRGALLHVVYETSLREARTRQVDYADADFEKLAMAALDAQVEVWRSLQPPPGGAVFAAEIDALRSDVRAFVEMVREDRPDWIGLELTFGRRSEAPFVLELDSGSVRLSGAIDRVDRLSDGSLRIVDYKTGSSFAYRDRKAPYRGGRRLQHVLYAAVASRLLDAEVAGVEYHFPTYREHQNRARFRGSDLREGLQVVDELLDLAASGHFHPTDNADDCRFCDYASVCRVTRTRGGKPVSAAAEWTRSAADVPELETLRRLRGR